MKARRSLQRRGFNVSTAGWFTVLRPDKWPAASRTPGKFYSSSDGMALDSANLQRATTAPSMVQLYGGDRHRMRTAWIVLAAMVVTSALLWWIMHP